MHAFFHLTNEAFQPGSDLTDGLTVKPASGFGTFPASNRNRKPMSVAASLARYIRSRPFTLLSH
jgi:hypothetical protein